jgi:predicted enzyme related to lactoylglutathione lyase
MIMPNIVYFEIPADDVDRAKGFYRSLLGWMIEPTRVQMDPAMKAMMEYHDVTTGKATDVTPMGGTLSTGGLYKRQIPGSPIINHVMVEDIDEVLTNVEKLGGKIVIPKMKIKSVGYNAIIQDTEGNLIGIFKPEMT